jgi:hypothetical protein
LLKNVGQGDKYQAGTCVGLDAYGKGSRENDKSCQYGNNRINDSYAESCFGEVGILPEIRGVRAKATRMVLLL